MQFRNPDANQSQEGGEHYQTTRPQNADTIPAATPHEQASDNPGRGWSTWMFMKTAWTVMRFIGPSGGAKFHQRENRKLQKGVGAVVGSRGSCPCQALPWAATSFLMEQRLFSLAGFSISRNMPWVFPHIVIFLCYNPPLHHAKLGLPIRMLVNPPGCIAIASRLVAAQLGTDESPFLESIDQVR